MSPGDDLEDSKAPLLDHLVELRQRLLRSIIAVGIAFAVCYFFAKEIFSFLVQPLVRAGQGTIIYTQIFEAFFVQIKVAFFAAMMLSFPIIANQLWQFIAPGLYKKERRAVLPFLFMTPVFFTAGASLAYFVAVPVALHFLLSFQGDIGGIKQEALPAVGNYLSFIMQFMFAFGLAFLMPILLMLLEAAGIVTRKQLVGARRYAIVGAFAISAVLTPPDPGSQLLLAIPLCLLYELTLMVTWFTEKRRGRTETGDASTA